MAMANATCDAAACVAGCRPATVVVPFFRPNEYPSASNSIHRVLGVATAANAVVWFGHIVGKVRRLECLLWSARITIFQGAFLFLWLVALVCPRVALSRELFHYVTTDLLQQQVRARSDVPSLIHAPRSPPWPSVLPASSHVLSCST